MAVTVAGCNTTVSGSVAQKTVPAGSGVDLLLLDAGNYPTKPRPPLGNAGDMNIGTAVEGRRMAGYVLGPWAVDPQFTGGSGLYIGVRKSAASLGLIFDDDEKAIGNAAAAHNLVTGFSDWRDGVNRTDWLNNVVLRFASPDDATAAAADMGAAAANLKVPFSDDPPVPHDPIPIPGHPDTSAVVKVDDDNASVHAFTAHGTFVLCQYAASTESPDRAAEVVGDTLDQQRPLIDQFQSTPMDQLVNLPIDPDGLIAHTLPKPPDDHVVGGAELYDARGRLHWMGDPIKAQKRYDAAKLQGSAWGIADVYQTPDTALARKLFDGFVTDMVNSQQKPAAGIKGLPDAKCFTGKDHDSTTYSCVATANRYTVKARSAHELDAHQKVSAQYLMLTNT